MKPFSSLFSKILLWFFMNLALVAAVLVVFFAFQSQIDLHAIFGRQASDRLQTAGRLISHELNQVPTANRSDVLARHAEIHQVDFALLLKGGLQSLSKDMEIPEAVMKMVMGAFRPKPPKGEFSLPPKHHDKQGKKRRFMMRTKNPTRYWAGVRIPVSLTPSRPPRALRTSCRVRFYNGKRLFFRSPSVDYWRGGGDAYFGFVVDTVGEKHHSTAFPDDSRSRGDCQGKV